MTDKRAIRECAVDAALSKELVAELEEELDALEADGRAELVRQGVEPSRVRARRNVHLRYEDADVSFVVDFADHEGIVAAFEESYRRRYGVVAPEKRQIVNTVTVEVTGRVKSALRETVMTVIYAVLIALAVRTLAYEPFNIPSGSMMPTLLVGDYLFVSKFSYGYSRHSFPFSPPLFAGRFLFSQPERGDVAVFKLPRDNETDYIKRIVGLPGDKIQVKGGVLYIDGRAVDRRQIQDYVTRDQNGRTKQLTQYREILPNGRPHLIIEQSDRELHDNTPVFTVPAGHYFVMGDNRDNSSDSRVIGFVPAENLVGRADFLFFSSNGSAQIWEFWKWPGAIRFSRLFRTIG